MLHNMAKKTKEQITYNMKMVRNKDSKIELKLRNALWEKGYRYRKNVKSVYGHPDIAFIGKKIAVFCDSEFWHGYDWENRKNDFKSNQDFWIPKIERNIERDNEVTEKLQSEGWTVIRFRGKDITKRWNYCIDMIMKAIQEKHNEKH